VFIDLIRNKLCLVLLQNGVSPIGAVARAALGLFGSVLQVFKVQLKSEVGILFRSFPSFTRVLRFIPRATPCCAEFDTRCVERRPHHC